jgi:glycosyltransferase involved in cell wall biosynthesis
MRGNYDLVIITNIPNYYKINLYNEISKSRKIYVVFMASSSIDRNPDFYSLANCQFDFIQLSKSSIEHRNVITGSIKLARLLLCFSFKFLVISEWFGLEYWVALLFGKFKSKTFFTLESNKFVAPKSLIKTLLKQLFLNGINEALVCGPSHAEMLESLGFTKKIWLTNGVGISNDFTFRRPEKINFDLVNILFVGRLIEDKNIKMMLRSFNEACKYRNLKLTIVGDGPLQPYVLANLNDNVVYVNKIANSDMLSLYEKNDILILPSVNEPWGLVVEEALATQMPVIISSKVGCLNSIVFDEYNGLVIDLDYSESLVHGLLKMTEKDNYLKFQRNASHFDRLTKDKEQVNVYLNALV